MLDDWFLLNSGSLWKRDILYEGYNESVFRHYNFWIADIFLESHARIFIC